MNPALLQVKNPSNTTNPNLIYITFGTGVGEADFDKLYAGWVVAYTATSTGFTKAVGYSNEPTSCGSGGGFLGGTANGQCNINPNSGTPACDCYAGSVWGNAPNWGGHGGGCWMSGNGPAASAIGEVLNSGGTSDGAAHVFFACGNGGFQELNGSTPNAGNNYGSSVLDFRLTSSGLDNETSGPFQSFTPNRPASSGAPGSGLVGLAPPAPQVCGCDSSGNNCTACPYTMQALNAKDYDFGAGGTLLFSDLANTPRLVTVDKAGYGYLLTQGNLCGAGTTDTRCIGWATGDPGIWTFGASKNLCANVAPNTCDRVTSMALSDYHSPTARYVYLHYWPYNERLTAIRLSDNSTAQTGNGQLTTVSGSTTNLKLAASCTLDVDCLTEQVVAGDALTLSGCTCQAGSNCPPIISRVTTNSATDTEITLNMSVAAAFGSSCTFPQNFQYTGYFVLPAHDSTPSVSVAGYPGAALTITTNCQSSPCVNSLVWAILPSSTSQPDSSSRGLGTLYAYTALPNAYDIMKMDWNSASTDIWCVSSFARPTVVNASAFVPTYAVSHDTRTFTACPTSATTPYPSGLLRYH